jgi:hypothetical protein
VQPEAATQMTPAKRLRRESISEPSASMLGIIKIATGCVLRKGNDRPRRIAAPTDHASGARYRVIIISACYSGVFARALADPRTLVITAAAPDRSSFGCEDGATWTYFGDAFFNQALREATTLDEAFCRARAIVSARERREGFEPSKPQMAGGSEVLRLLATPPGEQTIVQEARRSPSGQARCRS